MKVLLLEDDIQLNIAISTYMKSLDFDVMACEDGEEAINIVDNQNFDLYIIDINVPSINGLDILKYIRKKDIETPIIIITASLEITNLTDAYEYGCSEYLKKPFHLKELEVRIKKLIKVKKDFINFNSDFSYDLENKNLIHNNETIKLRKKEKKFIEILISNINKTVDIDKITDFVWEGEIKDSYPIRQLVNGLRKKLPLDIITTEVGLGYKIEKT